MQFEMSRIHSLKSNNGSKVIMDEVMNVTFSGILSIIITTQQSPPNFLRAAALGEYKRPVVVLPGEEHYEEEEVEPQPEVKEPPQMPQVCLHASQKRNTILHILCRSHDWLMFDTFFCGSTIYSVREEHLRLPLSRGTRRMTV